MCDTKVGVLLYTGSETWLFADGDWTCALLPLPLDAASANGAERGRGLCSGSRPRACSRRAAAPPR